MNWIAAFLMEQPDDFEPMFEESVVDGKTHTIVDEWCEGYIRGVALASEQWALTPAISIFKSPGLSSFLLCAHALPGTVYTLLYPKEL